jgi:MFS family permease
MATNGKGFPTESTQSSLPSVTDDGNVKPSMATYERRVMYVFLLLFYYDPHLKIHRRRVDWRILPLLALLYSFSLIDRSNLGIARVVGMGKDLGLSKGNRFSLVSLVYFIPYTLLWVKVEFDCCNTTAYPLFSQLPSNLILRQVGPRTWLSICVLGWGIAELCMGFSTHWTHLIICRVFLGAFEVCVFSLASHSTSANSLISLDSFLRWF